MKEAYREQRSLPWLETTVQDTRYAWRTLIRTPGFTFAALVALALGIGANTAIFSVVHAVLLRPLPYQESDRIVQLMRRNDEGTWSGQTGRRYMFFRDHLQSLETLAAWHGVGFNFASGDHSEYIQGLAVSKEYFDVLGVRPAYGEPFGAEHDRQRGPDVVIFGSGLWMRMFGGSPGAIGATVLLAERPHVVIGVMPEGFKSIPPVDVYIPLRPGLTGRGGGFNYTVVGRLKRNVTRAQAEAELGAAFEAFRREYPQAVLRREMSSALLPYQEVVGRNVKPALLVMLGAVAMLLLIACANTANLLLARASGRGREIAVRAALGAGRGRIVRQLLTESVILSLAGGAIGLLLAYWSVPSLLALTPTGYTVYQDVTIDFTVLAVTLGLSLGTGLLFGLLPAMSVSRHDLAEAFKDDGTRTTAGRRGGWLRKSLVVAEVALCMLLLVGAGLLVRTFVRLRTVDVGFDPGGVLTARMSLSSDRYSSPSELNRFYEQGLERIRRLPGVRAAAVVNCVPIEQGLNLNVDVLDGPKRIDNELTDWRYATARYFETMGIPIVAGRAFDERDHAGAPRVAVVSESFARRLLKDVNPLGRHIRVFDADGAMEIVGVARDVREQGLKGTVPMVMYVPVAQTHAAALRISHGYFQVSWVVRATDPGPELIRRIQEEIRALDPKQPFSTFRTMETVKAMSMASERFQMTLLTVLAGIGLLLATAGVYGLVAYSVAQRTREFGIRIALGATGGRILMSVVRQGAVLGLIGVAAGVAAAVAFTRTLQTFLFGVDRLDPWTIASVGMLLVAVAVAASFIAALRAVRLNPVTALRD